ncbi:protein TALPID3 [Sardina pilchardus]|uniref:protein TALPID3 n=1 Tax=Sardina pilchardus TaxID=27697 RepID=UPI002E155FCF
MLMDWLLTCHASGTNQLSSNDETSNSGSVAHQLVSEDLRASKQPVLSKEIRMQAVRKESQVPRRHEIPEVQTHVSQAGGSGHKARPDVVISTYAPGGKEAVRAAMKQRSQSAPVKRQVKVKLLDQSAALTPELQIGQQPQPQLQPSQVWPPATEDQHAATTAAAVTAAAIAATAPIMKAQSDMEAMMARLASELRRLQEMGSGGGRVQEGGASERVAQLEQQLSALTQQRLQHLELIQNQQLELQNRLMGSALDVVAGRASALAQRPQPVSAPPVMVNTPQTKHNPGVDKYTSDKAFRASGSQLEDQRGRSRSPLETPAPRKVIPKPVRWNSGVQPPKHHAPKASKQSRPEKGNGRLLEDILNNQRSPGRSTRSVGGKRVAMATAEHQTDKNREDQSRREVNRTSPGSSPAELGEFSGRRPQDVQPGLGGTDEPGPPSGAEAAETSGSAVRQANEMLQDLGRLKSEMQTLLQARDAFPVERSRSTLHSAPAPAPAPAAAPPPPAAAVSMRPQGASAVFMPTAVPLSRPSLLQKHPAPPSMFEDAGRVLREVRRSRKVLEDNLEALLRARDADALHWQLEALANNRDASEELRVRRTVDAWINTLNKEIQDELVREEVERERSREAAQQASGEGKAVAAGPSDPRPRAPRGPQAAASKRPLHRSTRGQENRQPPNKQALASSSAHTTQQQQQQPQPQQKPHTITEVDVRLDRRDDEEFLSRIYGKALYEGHRRTLKKGPYLRFSSPSPPSKAQRPKVIESVRGVKMKSSKTQTSLEPVPAPVPSEPRFLFTPTGPADQQDPASPMQGYLIPMAIPLGEPRVDPRGPRPSRVVISDRPVTVTTSYTPAPAPAAPAPRKPNVVLLEVRSEQARRPPPQLQVQVQPSVNIDSASLSSLSSAASPSPLPPPSSSPPPPPHLRPLPPASQAAEGKQPIRVEEEEEEAEEEEEDVFPGTNFLAVADIAQEPEEDAVLPDAPIELNGQATSAAPLYHGPAFPPVPPQPVPLTEPILATIHQRESVENRLVHWVEQQVMARVITEMFARRSQGDPTDHPEPAESEASEPGVVASTLGLQLFLDDGRPVEPAVLRHYVEETLAEVVSSMLGERERQTHTPEPAAPSAQQQPTAPEEAVVPTPVPTPEPSVRRSPPCRSHTQSPLDTPQASEHGSPEHTPREAEPQLPAPEAEEPPVATPTTTPVPSPPRVSTPSPPPAAPELASLRNHPWGDAELPLQEEQPHSEKEEPALLTPVVMSVAREEEPVLPSPPPAKPQTPVPPPAAATVVREPSPPPPPPAPAPAPATPPSPSSTEESSSGGSLTETEAVARHISEGELLLSYSHIAAARALEVEGLILPNLNASLSSSLLGVQDMDYDPPSEGQVVLRPHPRSQHDPILALLARMDRGPVTQQPAERSWEEGSSAGEVSEGQRPLLPAEGESVMSTHPLLEPSHTHRGTLTSPGQLTEAAGEAGLLSADGGGFGASQSGPHTQTSRPRPATAPPPPSGAGAARAPTPPAGLPPCLEEAPDPFVEPSHRPAPILVRQYEQRAPRDSHRPDPYHQNGHQDLDDFFEDRVNGAQASQQEAGAVKVMSVRLPSVPLEDNSASISTVEGDTDSSANDIF